MQLLVAALPTLTVFVPLVLVPAASPLWWARHRLAVSMAACIAQCCHPMFRSPLGVVRVLEGSPTQGGGWAALLKDVWKLALGTRVVSVWGMAVMTALLSPVPLLDELALLLFTHIRHRDTELMCRLPMLHHPTWQRRIADVHFFQSLVPLPIVGPARYLMVRLRPGAQLDAFRCRVFVGYFQLLVGVVVNLLIATWPHRKAPRQAHAAETATPAAGSVLANGWHRLGLQPGDDSSSRIGGASQPAGQQPATLQHARRQLGSQAGVKQLWAPLCKARGVAEAGLVDLCDTLMCAHGIGLAAGAWSVLLNGLWLLSWHLEDR